MDVVFHGFNSLSNLIGGDEIVVDSGTDDELEDSEGNGFLLVLGLPEETGLFDSKDILGESIEISVFTPWLDFPDDDGLGDGTLLLGGILGGKGLGLESSGSSFLNCRVTLNPNKFHLRHLRHHHQRRGRNRRRLPFWGRLPS